MAETIDEPLQLIEFVRKDDDGETEIQLKYENLNRILKPCGDRPLSILTVCGPSRMGKSFLLGYMIRCLEALEKEETDWMEWDKKTKPLSGFKFRSGNKPETQGIWVWSRPFIIKSEEGKEVCVLLVDTQGTQDEFTTTKDMSAIVGLSLLTSSVLVFNFFNNLQEDVLVALNTYIQYGLLALEHGEKGKAPFQKLIFMIRDWNNPGEFSFGEKGGKKFLEEKLEVKPDQPKEARELRKTIRKCFQDLDCFLMPHIGTKAIYPEFKGSISELDSAFARKLEEFISGLINIEDIVIKEILGDQITSKEFKSYLEMFVDTFNSEETPSPSNMLEATSKVHNQIQVQKSMRKYDESLKKRMRGKSYLSEEDLELAHDVAEKAAKDAFKKMKKIGDSETLKQYQAQLTEMISSAWEQTRKQNEDRRRSFITEANTDSMSTYRELLEEEFPLSSKNDTEFYEEKDMNKVEKRARSQVLDEFQDKLANETEENLQSLQQSLSQQLDVIFENLLGKNKSHRLSAEKEMHIIVKGLVEDYRNRLNDHFAENKFADFKTHEEFHEDTKKDTMDSFQDVRKPGGKEFQKKFLGDLKNLVDDAFQTQGDKLKLKLKDIQEQAESLIAEEHDRYLADLKAVISDEDCLEMEMLKKIHLTQKEDFLNTFDGSKYFPVNSIQHKKLVEKVGKELEKAYETVQHELEKTLEKSKECNQKAFAESVKYYQNAMKRFMSEEDGGFADDSEIEDAHLRFKEEAMEKFHNAPKIGPYGKNKDILEETLEDLGFKMDDLLDAIKAENVGRRDNAKLKATNLVNVCRSEYVKIMKKESEKSVKTEQDLTAAHRTAKEKAIGMFRKQSPIKATDFMECYLDQLEEEIEETFEEFVELFEMKKTEEDAKTKALLMDCRQQYLAEMEKQCSSELFMKPGRLETLHRNTVHIVLNKIAKTHGGGGSITPAQNRDMMEEMEAQFEGYKMKNDMKLNSEKGLGVAPAIGIDLGTTYCCVAVFYQGKVIIIPNLDQGGNLTTPSYVAYNLDGKDVVVGEPAKENAYKNAENTIYDAKRIIGRKMNDPVLQSDMKMWPFTVQEDGGIPKILANGQLLYPEQVSSKLLAYFKDMTEKYLKLEPGTIKKAVITVPAYFNDGQRQATVDAGKLAGLEVLTILNEPTAAAVAYSLERLEKTAKKVLVYDLGGGTFDVAVLDMKPKEIEVLGVDGDTHLGGEDFDKNMMTYCAQRFKDKHGVDLFEGKDSTDKALRDDARRRLRRVQTYCEKAKKQLATARSTKVTIDAIANGLDLEVDVSREKFEELNAKEFRKTIEIVERALRIVKVRKEEIDDIVLVGGSSRILKVQDMLRTYFGGKALNHTIHPDHCVAYYHSTLRGKAKPHKGKWSTQCLSKHGEYGAAVKAAMMNGEQAKGSVDFSKIQDVTPLSLGIIVLGGWMSTIIPKNTQVPCTLRKDYYTAYDNQTQVTIKIYQGEEKMAEDNEFLGKFELDGIPRAPSGKYPIDVCMEINSMGILHVDAFCAASGTKNSITIKEDKQRMSKETIERLLAESA